MGEAQDKATSTSAPAGSTAARAPGGDGPPGKRGPAIIVGITLVILSVGAVALLTAAFTMPRWQPPEAENAEGVGDNNGLAPFSRPLSVELMRDPHMQDQRPEGVPAEAELLQVRLFHDDALSLRAFRVELHIEAQQGKPHEAGPQEPWLQVAETMAGVEETAVGEEDVAGRHGRALELTPLNMPVRALRSGQRIASVWVVLPYKRHDLGEGTALLSDRLVAEIVEVDPMLPTESGSYARTEFLAD